MILWTGNRDRYRELASQKGRVVQHDIAKTSDTCSRCVEREEMATVFKRTRPSRGGHRATRPPELSCLASRHAFPRFHRKSRIGTPSDADELCVLSASMETAASAF